MQVLAARSLTGRRRTGLALWLMVSTTFAEGPERSRALGLFGAATAVGFVAGQVLGGVLTDAAGWRNIFIINVPVGILAAIAASRVILADYGAPARRVPDISGAVLITAAMALAVWAPAQGAERGWASASFLAPAAALALAAVFAAVEARRADPPVRLSMLRSAWMAGTSGATAMTGALSGVVVLLCTLFLQHVHRYSPLQAGFAFVPTGLAGLAARTLSAIVYGYGDNLLARAADVTLKERRRLALLVRETPLSLGHLRAMTAATECGAIIMPPVPAFYLRPRDVAEIVDHTASRALDLLGIDIPGMPRWGEEEGAA